MVEFRSGYRRNLIKSDETRSNSIVFYWDSHRIRQSESDRKEFDNFSTGSDRKLLRLTGSDLARFTWDPMAEFFLRLQLPGTWQNRQSSTINAFPLQSSHQFPVSSNRKQLLSHGSFAENSWNTASGIIGLKWTPVMNMIHELDT